MRSTPLSLGIGPVLALAGAGLLGCGETPAPVAPTVPAPTVAVAAPTAPPPVDLAPVPEPGDIFVVARWKNPGATVGGLSSCAGVPSQLVDSNLKLGLDRALATAFHGVDGKQIAEAIALDAPVDLVVSLEPGQSQPKPLFAFSVGLTSLERVRGALEASGPLVELQPGLWRVGAEGRRGLTCVIGPAAGVAPARLICGQHDKDVSALGPWMARNLATAAPPAQDLHAEVSFTTVEHRYGDTLRRLLALLPMGAHSQAIGEPHFDAALDEAATALADEAVALSGDLDRLSFDLNVDGASCLTGTGSLQLKGTKSWMASTLAERIDKAGPPPAIFWRAPIDSASASYGRAVDGARYNGILRVLRGFIEGGLAKEKIGSEADRKALAALFTYPVGKDTNFVVASGHGHAAAGAAAAASAAGGKPSEQQIADEIAKSVIGWYVMGFDEGPASLTKLVKDVVAVYGRKGLTDPLRKALGHDAESLPGAKLVPAPAPLGRGALDLELRFDLSAGRGHDHDGDAAASKKKAPGLVVHVLLMGDGKSTWMAVGADRDELVKRLLAAKSGAPEAGTLAARPGLEPLRNGKALGSGFLTLGVATRAITGVLDSPTFARASGSPAIADMLNTLNNLPHKGDTPIFLTSTAKSEGPRTEFVINMQKGSFEDVGAIVMTGLRIATNQGLLRP